METNTFLLLIVHLVAVSYAAKDLLGTKTENLQKSNTCTVKYEGTQEEAKEFGASIGLEFKRKVFGNWYVFSIPSSNHLGLKDVPDIHINLQKAQTLDRKVKYIQQETYRKRVKYSLTIENEAWPKQWSFKPSPNMNVYQAWEMGYTGSGITVAIVDDGIDVEHPDLIPNYDSSLAYDYVTERIDASHKLPEEGHGTNCAGLVAAANGTHCIIGIAFKSTFTGVRLLGSKEGETYDSIASMEASALTHNIEYIDIYSNSWGPPDDGIDMESLEPIVNYAFEYGIKNGRNGKGTIYTFASGNGGPVDNCNADPYSSSMYTISVAALNKIGNHTYYSEPCTSILTAAFSGDGLNFPNITTTGANQTCVDDFDGTSAACPQVSGIIALTLQANPELTWRDIQHMIVELSDHSGLPHSTDSYEFYTNGAGKKVSIWSGFGLMDAKAMVENAPTWPTAPPRISCGSGDLNVGRFETDTQITETFNVSNCLIGYLEHVHVNLYYKSSYRGDVEVYLTSPMGTESKILTDRYFDKFTDYSSASLMSVHTWGEIPNGLWELSLFPIRNIDVHFEKWSLDLYGTATYPLDGIPAVGGFGSPCDSSASCGAIADGGCLKDPKPLCDNMCISCRNGYHRNVDMCEKGCGAVSSISNGVITSDNNKIGSSADVDCDDGYEASNPNVICQTSGLWETATCDVKDCGTLPQISFGELKLADAGSTTFGSSASVVCAMGYLPDKQTITCQSSGWELAVCTIIDCGAVPNVAHGSVRLNTNNRTTYAAAAYVTCDSGYKPKQETIMCQATGNWETPACGYFKEDDTDLPEEL